MFIQAIEKLEVKVLISVQHRWILSEKILSKLNGNAFNLHNAKLPEFKGYNSISHAIYSNASKYFVTIHKIDTEVDSGSIVAESEFEISSEETALSLYKKTIPVAKLLFEKFLSLLSNHSLVLKLFSKILKTNKYTQGQFRTLLHKVNSCLIFLYIVFN